MKNLKLILSELNQRLQQEYQWIPGTPPNELLAQPAIAQPTSTQPIVDFLHFLNASPQATGLLKDYNIEWGVTNKPDTRGELPASEELRPDCCVDSVKEQAKTSAVTDTPRTNSIWGGLLYTHSYLQKSVEETSLIERELNAANDQLHKVCIRCGEWAEIAGKHGAELDRLRALINTEH
jgi:hypothetical protein